MRRSALAAGLALAASHGQQTFAQASRILVPDQAAVVKGATKNDARVVMKQFGECVISVYPNTAMRVIETPVDAPDYDKTLKHVATSECLGGGDIRIPTRIMRGSLFEAMYRARYVRFGPSNLSASPEIDYAAGYKKPLSDDARGALAMAMFGDCVSRANTVNARKFVLSQPASSEEDGAIHELSADLGPCLSKGLTVTITRDVLKAAVAEGLYRLSSIAPANQ